MQPMTRPEQSKCRNCGADLLGPVCAQCGQPEAQPIETRRLLRQFVAQLSELDFKFVHALRDVVISPGVMINGYLDGRRLRYTNPFKLLFFVATIYFLIVAYFDIQISPDRNVRETSHAVLAIFNYLVFVMLALLAPLLRWLFPAPKRGWAENYVTVLYLWSGYTAISCLVALAMVWIDRYFLSVRTLVGLIYLTWGFKQVFALTWRGSAWRSLLFFASYFAATTGIVTLIIVVSRRMGLGFMPSG